MSNHHSQELPDLQALEGVCERYPVLDPLALSSFLHIVFTAGKLGRRAEATFREFDVSMGRFMLLIQLFNKYDGTSNALSPAEMAERLHVTRATVTGLVDGLERDGIVERKKDESDRRMVIVALTQAGIDLMEKLIPVHFERVGELLSCFSDLEKEQLISLMGKLHGHASELLNKNDIEEMGCCMGPQ